MGQSTRTKPTLATDLAKIKTNMNTSEYIYSDIWRLFEHKTLEYSNLNIKSITYIGIKPWKIDVTLMFVQLAVGEFVIEKADDNIECTIFELFNSSFLTIVCEAYLIICDSQAWISVFVNGHINSRETGEEKHPLKVWKIGTL